MKIRPGMTGRIDIILTIMKDRGQLSLVLLSLAAPPINHQTIKDRKAQTTPAGMESLIIADTPQTTNQPKPRAQSPYTITRRTPVPPQFVSKKIRRKIPPARRLLCSLAMTIKSMGFNQNNEIFSILLQFLQYILLNKNPQGLVNPWGMGC